MTNAGTERIIEVLDFAEQWGDDKAVEFFNVTHETLGRYRRKRRDYVYGDPLERKRVLVFDIETAPMEAYVWSMWKNDISQDQLIQDWSILCWAAKWLDGTEIYTGCSWLDNNNVRDDKACCLALRTLLDMADIVVAHNGDKFDIKKVNTRLLKHGIKQPSPYKSVDTLKIAKSR